MKPVVDSLFYHARNSPDKVALIVGNQHVTYREMADHTIAVAKYFTSLGVKKASPVILSADASSAFIYGYFACHLLSAICVPVDPKCSEVKLNYIAKKVEPNAVFTSKGSKVEGVYSGHVSELLNYLTIENNKTNYLIPTGDCIADVLFTSGTTGDAKGVILTHGAISIAANHINRFIGNSYDDREVMPLPLSHSFGLGRLRCNVVTGATIILVPGFTNPALLYCAIEQCKATGLASVPAGFAILLSMNPERIRRYANQLKYIEIGSAPMPMEHKKFLMKALPKTRICMHYGLTEASRSVFIEFHQDKEHLSSVGQPAHGVEIRIEDEQGSECNNGEPGRILIKGGHCTVGYWNNIVQTKKNLINGWLVTGDVGYIDSSGYLHLLAREDDIINIGGMKVSPAEVEEQIATHPSICDCVCVGIPDPRGISGQAIKAFLVKSAKINEFPSEKEIDNILRGVIEPYKIPVSYEWVEEIPKTESGKIKRRDMLK